MLIIFQPQCIQFITNPIQGGSDGSRLFGGRDADPIVIVRFLHPSDHRDVRVIALSLVNGVWIEIKNRYNVQTELFCLKRHLFENQYPKETLYVVVGDLSWSNPETDGEINDIIRDNENFEKIAETLA